MAKAGKGAPKFGAALKKFQDMDRKQDAKDMRAAVKSARNK